MTLRLKAAIAKARMTQGDFAQAMGLSRSALNLWINRDVLPVSADREDCEDRAKEILRARGAVSVFRANGVAEIRALFTHEETEKEAPPCNNTAAPDATPNTTTDAEEAITMLLRKQVLSPQARQHFALARDPFGDVRALEDVFLSGDIRYVRESMWSVVRHGGFLAVIGESGSGKSTLREELIERIKKDSTPAIAIQPYVLAMEDNDTKGKTLKAAAIAEAILATVAPQDTVRRSPDARFRQLHNVLRESTKAGHAHVLIIEEAHALPIPTLKHLKRFLELKDGFRSLLGVILLGQPELANKLLETDPRVREVVQRVEIVHLPPLNNELEGYLKHRFERVGTPLSRVLEAAAIDALRTRLTTDESLLYPLVIHNLLTAAMNAAAALGLPRVTANVVREI